MPYFSCPRCRLTHYAPADTRRTECPSCTERSGRPVRLFVSSTLTEARRRLAAMPRGEQRATG
jgi:hypothetical protein